MIPDASHSGSGLSGSVEGVFRGEVVGCLLGSRSAQYGRGVFSMSF